MKPLAITTMLLMLSCAASQTTPAEPWSVAVTSSGGMAGRGAGSFAIDSEGAVAVTTMSGKSCTFRATAHELEHFRELITRARPEGWQASYVPANPCCDRFEYELTLDFASKKTSVKWIDDPMPMPADLTALVAAMVESADSLRVAYGAKCQSQ